MYIYVDEFVVELVSLTMVNEALVFISETEPENRTEES